MKTNHKINVTDVSVIVPAYNENNNTPLLIDRIGNVFRNNTCSESNGNGTNGGGGSGGGGGGDDKKKTPQIPLGNFYLVFLIIGIIGMIGYVRRKYKITY